MDREKKENLLLMAVILEFIAGCVFFVLYLKLDAESDMKGIYYGLCIVMLFVAVITIITCDLGGKVAKVAKKVATVVFNVTIGAVFRIFDSLLNMTTGTRTANLKIIRGYEDNVFSVREKKKKRKANYKRYKLMDNREKVRFLYYKSVTKAMRKGFAFKEADTPYEVNERLINRKYLKDDDRQFGEIYSISRYDEKGEITDEMVEAMKGNC